MVMVQRTMAAKTTRIILHRRRRRRLPLQNYRLPLQPTMAPHPASAETTTKKSSMVVLYSVFTIGIHHGFKVTFYHRLHLHLRRRRL